MTVSRTAKSIVAGALLSVVSVTVLFGLGEVICRLFFPDTGLRYQFDRDALYRLTPNHTGTFDLANGTPAPPARINRMGLRGPEPIGGRPSVLVLGDSFTFGSGVRDEQTFPARLHAWADGALDVVNGGHPGYGVFQMEAALTRLSKDLRPSLVVVVIWQGEFLRQPPSDAERARFHRRQALSNIVKKSVLATHLYRRIERLLIRT